MDLSLNFADFDAVRLGAFRSRGEAADTLTEHRGYSRKEEGKKKSVGLGK
jgi:hypothetical protein